MRVIPDSPEEAIRLMLECMPDGAMVTFKVVHPPSSLVIQPRGDVIVIREKSADNIYTVILGAGDGAQARYYPSAVTAAKVAQSGHHTHTGSIDIKRAKVLASAE